MKIWTGIGNWEIPRSWKDNIAIGESISGTILFQPYNLMQNVISVNSVDHLGGGIIEIQGKVESLNPSFFVLDVGTQLLSACPPYAWMFEKHTLEGFGQATLQMSDNFETHIPNYRISGLWSDINFFSKLRSIENKPIHHGSKSPALVKSIRNLHTENPPKKLNSTEESKTTGPVDYFCLELETLDEPIK